MTNGAAAMVQGHTGGFAGGALVPKAERVSLAIRFTDEEKRVILETCCNGATPAEARALIAIAEARGMSPILGECYFVKRWDSQRRQEVWSVQAAIDSLRIKAEQTGLYAGQDEPEYEHNERGEVILARVRVWRKDWPRPAVGVARWSEYVQTTKDGTPTRFWERMPHNQLAKCAEALALRKAFPAVLSKVYTPEEMAQADNEVPAPAPFVRVEQPAPQLAAPAADPEREKRRAEAFARLAERVDEAETASALNQVAKDAVRAHKAGHLTDETFAALKSAVTRKRDLVAGKAPPAAASSGRALDEQSAAEQDAEAEVASYGGDQ